MGGRHREYHRRNILKEDNTERMTTSRPARILVLFLESRKLSKILPVLGKLDAPDDALQRSNPGLTIFFHGAHLPLGTDCSCSGMGVCGLLLLWKKLLFIIFILFSKNFFFLSVSDVKAIDVCFQKQVNVDDQSNRRNESECGENRWRKQVPTLEPASSCPAPVFFACFAWLQGLPASREHLFPDF